MLGRRLIGASIVITTLLVLVTIDFLLGREASLGRPGLILGAFSIVMAAMASSELADMFRDDQNPIPTWVPVSGTTAMVAIAHVPLLWRDYPIDCPMGVFGWATCGLVVAMVITFLNEMMQFRGQEMSPRGVVIDRMGKCFFIYGYLSMLFAFLVPHRILEDDNALGLVALISMITTVKMSDSFAYFVGKSIGKGKIAPKLSPKKTIQGSVGALVGGWAGAALMVFVIAPNVFRIQIDKPIWWFAVYGTLVTLAGMLGDLSESLVKRDSECKDSSRWLPGLGGILDMADSMIFAAPVSFLLWIA